MSIITNMLTGSIKDVVEPIGELIDNLFTSDEERLKAKNELNKIAYEAREKAENMALEYDKQVTDRWKSDNENGTWLTRSIRPLVLLIFTIAIIILAVTDGNIVYGDYKFTINQSWVSLFKDSFMTMIIGYFGARSVEKVASSVQETIKINKETKNEIKNDKVLTNNPIKFKD